MSKTPVSALIITRNEERYIERCLQSLTWADEIIVVDSESTDKTKQLCEASGKAWSGKLCFITQAWLGFSEQRNVALKAAKHDWVYFADADEECTPELIAKIEVLRSRDGGPEHTRYRIYRFEYFLGKKIKYGMWNPIYHDRFYNKKNCHFEGGIHERLVHPAEPVYLQEGCNHDLYLDTDKFLFKLNRYSTLQAEEDVAGGLRTNIFRLSLSFPHMFLKHLFYYKSYRDGMHGVIISLLEAVYRVVRHIKIWEIQNGYGRYQTTPKNR
ncbi:MAG: glycosyltransferase family 2 protein [Xanthomonadaceae bacterium]|nr:glycosyltransferase family 2 protein [Xanthomonadaceae bacterium]